MATGSSGVDCRVSCGVCLQPYGGRRAILLPCLDTFCLPCLEERQTFGTAGQDEKEESSGSLTCPTCQCVIPLPPGGVADLKDNFYLYSSSGEADSEAVACTVCEGDQTAQFLCGQCHNHICSQCRRAHDKCCQGSQVMLLPPPSYSSAVQSTAHRGAMSSAQASPRNLNDLYQKVEDLAGQVTSLQSANTQLTLHVDLLSSTHNKLSTEHCVLKREVTSLREKNDQLTSGQAGLQREVRALRDKQAIAHQDLAMLTAEKDKARAGLVKLQTDLLSMQTDASLQQTDILRLKADHGQVAAKLSAVQTDTATMQTDITTMKANITTMKTDIQTDITTMKANITTMQTDIQTDITTMKANITTMKTDIQTDITALQGGEASVKRVVDQLKTDCGQLTLDVAKIQGVLTALESRFATANTQVGFHAALTKKVTTSKEQTLVCDGIFTNVGGGYDGGTGVFTAPVTGTYCFMANTSPNDADVKKAARLDIVVDGVENGYVRSDGFSWSTGHTVVKVTRGQTVWLRTFGDREYTFFGGGWTRFSGMLLQAEV